MKIIVPMAGAGWRFRKAGYADAKPLVPVDGRPMAGHVRDLFPGERDFLFIVNAEHAERTGLLNVLEEAAPGSKVAAIPPHREGPVYSVSRVFDAVPDDEEVIVNYCDFSKAWSYQDFLRHTRGRGADGAVAAYKGFHPHMLAEPNYAFIRHERQWLLEIREKHPFTSCRMSEFASDGTYYFRTGALMKKYFSRLMERGIRTEGEYYVSMVYNLMLEDGLRVSVYEIEAMLQWGTPRDLSEYRRWSDYFRRAAGPGPDPRAQGGILLMPMAGEGRRFREAGYAAPKPLIEVNGTPMFVAALRSLPRAEKAVFVASSKTLEMGADLAIRSERPDAAVKGLAGPTGGEALTCREGLAQADPDAAVLIAPCDAGVLWDYEEYRRLMDDPSVDLVVWTAAGHEPAARRPEMFGWVKADPGGRVTEVAVKRPLSAEPIRDRVILGLFTFKKIRRFLEALKALEARAGAVNGEYHVDSCAGEALAAGLRVHAFDVEGFACWGTPEELRTYQYWQKFFHRCARHPYDLAKHQGLERAGALAASFEGFRQGFE
ncbi:MAG: NTP transferase domain-containing protein [Elusimicrobia bacterium]|nr:NTP transferase domain-containing protein [Elusimicrobiota bacterium]